MIELKEAWNCTSFPIMSVRSLSISIIIEDLAQFSFEALRGVSVFPHSLSLSLFFRIHCTVVRQALMLYRHRSGILLLQCTKQHLAALLMTRFLYISLQKHFSCMCFMLFWLIINNYGQKNTKKLTSLHIKHMRRDTTYTTLYRTKQETKFWLCAHVIFCGFSLRGVVIFPLNKLRLRLHAPANAAQLSVMHGGDSIH